MAYSNPVIPGFHPDPSVCRVGEDYYLVTSTFEYFPGVPIHHSRDLVHWRLVGHCLTRDSQLPLQDARASAGIFAPTIRHHGGRFYMVTTNTTRGGNFLVTAPSPTGPWSDPVLLAQPGIDPSLLFDDDGRVYLTTASKQIVQSEIDPLTGRLLSAIRPVWPGTGGKCPEAPHLYRVNGCYYLMLAEGGTEYGHMITMARSATPWGPWEICPRNPLLTHRNTYLNPIQATGHADLVEAHDGSWWVVLLGIQPQGGMFHHLGRETFLAPVSWREDAWPEVNSGALITPDMEVASLPARPWPDVAGQDHFDSPVLRPEWNFRRNPSPASWSLEERPGWLRLRGLAGGLDDAGPLAFVGRRQQHLRCRVRALLDFNPVADADEAGLTVIMNERHHHEIVVRSTGRGRAILLRRRIGGLQVESRPLALSPGPVELCIQADPATYVFSAVLQGREQVLGDAECRYLSSEVAGGFTGVYFGMFAASAGVPSGIPADFDWFEYEAGPT